MIKTDNKTLYTVIIVAGHDYRRQRTVVGDASITTIESAIRDMPDAVKTTIRKNRIVRMFIERGPENGIGDFTSGYHLATEVRWTLEMSRIDEVLP